VASRLHSSGLSRLAAASRSVRPAGAPAGGVLGQPPAQDRRHPGCHGRQRFRDRRVLAQAGIHHFGGVGMDPDPFGEHLGFELPAGSEEVL
jgi:hypothetical protein